MLGPQGRNSKAQTQSKHVEPPFREEHSFLLILSYARKAGSKQTAFSVVSLGNALKSG